MTVTAITRFLETERLLLNLICWANYTSSPENTSTNANIFSSKTTITVAYIFEKGNNMNDATDPTENYCSNDSSTSEMKQVSSTVFELYSYVQCCSKYHFGVKYHALIHKTYCFSTLPNRDN